MDGTCLLCRGQGVKPSGGGGGWAAPARLRAVSLLFFSILPPSGAHWRGWDGTQWSKMSGVAFQAGLCLHCTAPIVDRSLLHSHYLSISAIIGVGAGALSRFHLPFFPALPASGLEDPTRERRDRVAVQTTEGAPEGVATFQRLGLPAPRLRVFCCFPEVVGPGWAGPRVASGPVPFR